MPSAIEAEFGRVPPDFLEDIVSLRAFARVWQAYEAATTPEAIEALPDTPLITMAREIEQELGLEALAEQTTDVGR